MLIAGFSSFLVTKQNYKIAGFFFLPDKKRKREYNFSKHDFDITALLYPFANFKNTEQIFLSKSGSKL